MFKADSHLGCWRIGGRIPWMEKGGLKAIQRQIEMPTGNFSPCRRGKGLEENSLGHQRHWQRVIAGLVH